MQTNSSYTIVPRREESITANSSRHWMFLRIPMIERYLRRFHDRKDKDAVRNLLFHGYPDEGKKLLQNYSLNEYQKKWMLTEYLIFSPQLMCGIFADQRQGKDATLCAIFENVFAYCDFMKIPRPRIVTLGNMRQPPFVRDGDMYFSFKNIPFGKRVFDKDGEYMGIEEVWIYSSEIEVLLPARQTGDPENKLFALTEGTMAQNHAKLFGCCKLASKVDINFIRGMNCKIFKYIDPEKLRIEGVERLNIISDLGRWLLPKQKNVRSEALLSFDDNLLTVNFGLPSWWTDEYSEQFADIPESRVWDFIDSQFGTEEKVTVSTISNIQTVVAQKFRKNFTPMQIRDHLLSFAQTSETSDTGFI